MYIIQYAECDQYFFSKPLISQDLALQLQEQELLEQDTVTRPNPVQPLSDQRDDHYHLPPPTSREEYEKTAQQDRNKSSSSVSDYNTVSQICYCGHLYNKDSQLWSHCNINVYK